jgi:WD40 repeat protein
VLDLADPPPPPHASSVAAAAAADAADADPLPPYAPAAELLGHTGAALCVRFAPDGTLLASGGMDATARLWAADGSARAHVFAGQHSGVVADLDWSADSRQLVTGGLDRLVAVWDVASGQPVATMAAGALVHCVATTAGVGGLVLAGTGVGTVLLLDPRSPAAPAGSSSGRLWPVVAGSSGGPSVTSIHLASDGSSVFTGDAAGFVRVWDLRAGAAQPCCTASYPVPPPVLTVNHPVAVSAMVASVVDNPPVASFTIGGGTAGLEERYLAVNSFDNGAHTKNKTPPIPRPPCLHAVVTRNPCLLRMFRRSLANF